MGDKIILILPGPGEHLDARLTLDAAPVCHLEGKTLVIVDNGYGRPNHMHYSLEMALMEDCAVHGDGRISDRLLVGFTDREHPFRKTVLV
jgi:hypothetical protein